MKNQVMDRASRWRGRRTSGETSTWWIPLLVGVAVAAFGCTSSSKKSQAMPDSGGLTIDASIETSVLGATCSSDSDCGSGFTCATTPGKELYGGAPAEGYCTRSCTGLHDSSCVAYGGLCEDVSVDSKTPSWRCLEICSPGGKTQDARKCHGRTDTACHPVTAQLDDALGELGLCYPVCSGNSDCGSSLSCDPQHGVCTKDGPQGDADGSSCTDSASCAGDCVGYSDAQGDMAYGFCSSTCAFGEDGACAEDGWACAFGDSSVGIGDLAHCQPKCDTDSDCKGQLPADPKLHCDKTTLPVLGYGVCAWGVVPDAGTGGNMMLDASPAADASSSAVDASMASDASVMRDAAATVDASSGSARDASMVSDASSVRDASSALDASKDAALIIVIPPLPTLTLPPVQP